MQRCLLKFIVDENLNDAFTDTLLAYPEHDLQLTSYLVQTHHQGLELNADIRELVSGFKQKVMFEITLGEGECQSIHKYVKAELPHAEFQAQLLPLLSLEA
ncbi:MAG: DUF3240 family protein [Thiotrichales bacterium]|nr:DUF3240 family protein [Thiotrichales bacterium]